MHIRPYADRSFLCFTVQLLPTVLHRGTSKLNFKEPHMAPTLRLCSCYGERRRRDTFSSASKQRLPAISFEKVYLVFCDLCKLLCPSGAQGIAARWRQRSYIPSLKTWALLMRRLFKQGMSQHAIARQFGTRQTSVFNIVRRNTWAHLPEEK